MIPDANLSVKAPEKSDLESRAANPSAALHLHIGNGRLISSVDILFDNGAPQRDRSDLGNFQSVVQEHNGYRVQLYANHQLERALTPKAVLPPMPPVDDPFRRWRPKAAGEPNSLPPSGPPNPAARMDELTKGLLDTLDFMTEEFGPSPHPQYRRYTHPRRIRPGVSGVSSTSPRSLISIRGSDPRPFASPTNRPSIPNCWRPMKWRTNGGGTWWFRPAIATTG